MARPKGSLNKSTKEVKKIAQKYTDVAIKELARLATKAESEQARVSACRELLDRGHGKPAQTISGDAENPIQISLSNLLSDIDGRTKGIPNK